MPNLKVLRSILLLIGFCLQVTDSGYSAVVPTYPGSAPGFASVQVADGQIAISNAALAATWKWQKSGLRLSSVRDNSTGASCAFTNDLFRIVLTNGQVLAAADLKARGVPTVTPIPPDTTRLPGSQVSLDLVNREETVRVRWRAWALDEANYFRQEIQILPNEDLAIAEIQWLQEFLSGANQHGQVDGSVVGAGTFFFGCEDPNARNEAPASQEMVGQWKTDDIAIGRRRKKQWTLGDKTLVPGTNVFTFQYERGSARLDVWKVSIVEDGQEIATDAHHGSAGVSHASNVYTLMLRALKTNANYVLSAEISTDPDWSPAPGQAWDSFGRITFDKLGDTLFCRVPRGSTLHKNTALAQSFVVGVVPVGQLRRGFLYYNERERAHPYRPYLHYNSWYDISWKPFELNETNCLEAIRIMGERLVKERGVKLDGILFDDGWDDPKSLWNFHPGFPRGFAPHAELCRAYDTRLATWLSPFGGYGRPRDQRMEYGRRQGFEVNAAGFSLAGPRYYQAFRNACLKMIREYGVNHFKFDGIATGMYAAGSAQYLLDTEAMCRLIAELRVQEPELFINLTTGSWPSPFWLRHADSVWRQGDDMGFTGPGTKQQQWITYRDRETYRNIVRRGPLYPLNSLMNQGISYSRQGTAGDPAFNSAGFKEDVRSFFGTGTGTQELYIQPGKLSHADWDVLAEGAKWSRANSDVLVDSHWIGGDPGAGQVYGYASWAARKGLIMLRNPSTEPQKYALDLAVAFELPPSAPTRYALRSPWTEDAHKPRLEATAGAALNVSLAPFEILVLEAVPE